MPKQNSKLAAIPPYHHMMWPTLQALMKLGNSGSNQEINDKVIEIMRFTEDQLGTLHGEGPQTEIVYRLHWARTYLKVVGALQNTGRGVWAITDAGRSLTSADMAGIPAQVRLAARKDGVKAQGGGASDAELALANDVNEVTGDSVGPPSLDFTSTDREKWGNFLLDELLSIAPASFEKLCQRMLREAGFTKVEVTGRSGDGGLDGIGVLRVSLLSFHVFFQCKRYRGSVGASAIRDFRGAMVGRTDKGLFITTGVFTPDAKREATRDGAPVLDLIDGEALCDQLKRLGLGVSTRQVEEVTIDSGWFRAL